MTEVNTPVLDALADMNEGVAERSGLDPETFMLVRIAALASTGAAGVLSLEPRGGVGPRIERRAGPGCPDRHRPRGRNRSRGQRRRLDGPGTRTRHGDRRRVGVERGTDQLRRQRRADCQS